MSALNQRKLEKTVMNRRGGADRVLGFIWQGRDVFQMERLGASNLRRRAGLYLVGWLALCLRRGPEGRAMNSSYPKRSAFSLTFSLSGWFTEKSFSGGVTNQTWQKGAFKRNKRNNKDNKTTATTSSICTLLWAFLHVVGYIHAIFKELLNPHYHILMNRSGIIKTKHFLQSELRVI